MKEQLLSTLTKLGYTISYEHACVITGPDEKPWVGRGQSQEEAFSRAVDQMLPSALAKQFAEQRLAHENVVRTDVAIEQLPHHPAEPGVDDDDHDHENEDDCVRRLNDILGALTDPDATAQLAAEAPDRQRASILFWAAETRDAEECAPSSREIGELVTSVMHRLNELAKMFWPGIVRALQVGTRPEGVAVPGGGPSLSTWARIADEADRWLVRPPARGFDVDGWADPHRLDPRPKDPDEILRWAHGLLPSILDGAIAGNSDLDMMLRIAQSLRWIRGACDRMEWGRAMGLLRQAIAKTYGRIDDESALGQAIHPRRAPHASWASIVGPFHEERRSADSESSGGPGLSASRAAMLGTLESAKGDPEQLVTWLSTAFDLWSTPDLAVAINGAAPAVLGLAGTVTTHPDQRVRRRLGKLIEELRAGPPREASSSDEETEEAHEPQDQEARLSDDPLTMAVRNRVRGARVLVMAPRDDRRLRERLERLLGVSTEHLDFDKKNRVDDIAASVRKGNFGLIVAMTGFMAHRIQDKIKPLAIAAGTPYVCANKGRPRACIEAIARDLGVCVPDSQANTVGA